jgi:hypothetical protein
MVFVTHLWRVFELHCKRRVCFAGLLSTHKLRTQLLFYFRSWRFQCIKAALAFINFQLVNLSARSYIYFLKQGYGKKQRRRVCECQWYQHVL